jgi:hypothetical protein
MRRILWAVLCGLALSPLGCSSEPALSGKALQDAQEQEQKQADQDERQMQKDRKKKK